MAAPALRGSPPPTRTLSWDGVTLTLPAAWELTLYKFLRKGVSRIEVEDSYSIRLEGEWVRRQHPADLDLVRARYTGMAKRLTRQVDRQETLVGLPEGWLATYYELPPRELPSQRLGRRADEAASGLRPQRMITAFYSSGGRTPFFGCFFLWFGPQDEEDPRAVMKCLAETLDLQRGPLLTWALMDLEVTVPSDFQLVHTLFDIGAKLMVFRWRWRRFFIWHFSLASKFLPSAPNPETWCSGYLNGFARINGVTFLPGTRGEVTWKRKRIHTFGHSDELARWCFRYKARCQLLPDKDQLVLWVFHFRHELDLNVIPANLRFGPPLHLADSEPRLPPGLTAP